MAAKTFLGFYKRHGITRKSLSSPCGKSRETAGKKHGNKEKDEHLAFYPSGCHVRSTGHPSSPPIFMTHAEIDLVAAYAARLRAGDLAPDPAQEQAVQVLQSFAATLTQAHQARPFWQKWFKGTASVPHGLYLYGDVGRGKSMLMDLFFAQIPLPRKRRVHFHQFMLEIHDRLHQLHQKQVADVLPRVARAIAAETDLLCFDEFHVGNIADAMILGRLFQGLFDAGVTVVATPNWPPDQLYKNGLQRDRFLPFIALIQKSMIVHCLNGDTDHRFEQTRRLACYTHPLSPTATHGLQDLFTQLTASADLDVIELPVQGRVLRLTHAARGVGFFQFDELCAAALGAADYLALASCLHTVLIDNVPRLTGEKRNETTRFITLIDALYEAKVKLYMAAADSPEKLAPSGELHFPFQRTVSRLMEMQGEAYRQKPHLGG